LRCNKCSGPLFKSEKNQVLQCKWCAKSVTFWQCQYCKSTKNVTTVSGQKKIVEEIGKSFPGVKIVTSGGKNILRKIKNEKCIVVATPGAEPISQDPYSALIVIDAYLYLAKGGLSSNEDTYRKWINAISLVSKKSEFGKVFINLDTDNRIIQSFIKKSSNWYLEQEFKIRDEIKMYPIYDTYVVTGLLEEINEINLELTGIEDLVILGPNIDEQKNEARIVCMTNNKKRFPLELRALINRFSLKKRNPVRVKYNPYDID
jgi:primosomal protein N' (replication factor Y)